MSAPLTETREKKIYLLLEIVTNILHLLAFKKKQDLDSMDFRKLKEVLRKLNEVIKHDKSTSN